MPEGTTRIIGNYQTLSLIGEGAERRVFAAECVQDGGGILKGERVALHCLRDRERRDFEREAGILGSLDHPNILRYRQSFVTHDDYGDLFCLVTELLEGETLKTRIDNLASSGEIPWPEIFGIFSSILEALNYAHARGVIHRDLKVSNIFLTAGGAKLIDFGIARREQDSGETHSIAGVRGSFDYMAPDFARLPYEGFRGDETSDVFSFGVCLYQALTRKLPFGPLEDESGYHDRWRGDKTPGPDFNHPAFRVRPGLRNCIVKCLATHRPARFSTFAEVQAAFTQIKPLRIPPLSSSGQEVGDVYECVELLGAGGFGEVFLARHLRQNESVAKVAVKRLVQLDYSERFKKEARMLQELSHPNLVRYIDFHEVESDTGPQYFLVMEYLEGMPAAGLRSRIRNPEDVMEPDAVLRLFLGYLDGLACLHQNKIIHRDIKPHNLYAPGGGPATAKIFDLGIALDLKGTRTHGPIPGSWDYMPPEFATPGTERGTPQSDMYSLGVTLFQALTRTLPFPPAKTWLDFLARAESPVPCAFDHPVFEQRPELVPLLQRALAPRAEDRYRTAVEMRDAVQDILTASEATTVADPAIVLADAKDAIRVKHFGDAIKLCQGIPEADPHRPEAEYLVKVATALQEADQAEVSGNRSEAMDLVKKAQASFPGDELVSQRFAELGGEPAKPPVCPPPIPPQIPAPTTDGKPPGTSPLPAQAPAEPEPPRSRRPFPLAWAAAAGLIVVLAAAAGIFAWHRYTSHSKAFPLPPPQTSFDTVIPDRGPADEKSNVPPPLRILANETDRALDNELNAFKVWFGLLPPNEAVLNPPGYSTDGIQPGNPAQKLEHIRGRVNYYRDKVQTLRQRFKQRGLAPQDPQDFDKLRRVIENWPQK
jgi:serine/threonine protein kinase